VITSSSPRVRRVVATPLTLAPAQRRQSSTLGTRRNVKRSWHRHGWPRIVAGAIGAVVKSVRYRCRDWS
jgi:hypothetical protein